MNGIIYKATNRINGKSYIGYTTKSLKRRKSSHISYALNRIGDFHFHRAIRKYGVVNFEWEIIKECCSKDELIQSEIDLIKKHDTYVNGYNMTYGGDDPPTYWGEDNPCYGRKLSEKAKNYLSKLNSGKNHPKYGTHLTEETKKKISISNKGRCKGKKHRLYGKKLLLSTIEKMSDSASLEWVIISPTGDKFIVKNLYNFCKKRSLSACAMYDVANKKRRHHKNYKCKKINSEIIKFDISN
jgi:group I intron endonuclease